MCEKRIPIPFLWFCIVLWLIYSCEQDIPQGRNKDISVGYVERKDLNLRTFELDIDADGLSTSSGDDLRALVFSGYNGNVPKIKDLTRRNEDRLLFYLFSMDNDGRPIHPAIKQIPLMSEADFGSDANAQKEGYMIDSSSGSPRLRLRVNLPMEDIVNTMQAKSWYIGAMLNGKVNDDLAIGGQAYQFEEANNRLVDRRDATEELRAIPLMTPITRLTEEMLRDNRVGALVFKPRGILFNFNLRNTTVHRVEILELAVRSKEVAFSAIYSLQDQHLRRTLAGGDDTPRFPLAVSGKDRGEIASSEGLSPDDKEWKSYILKADDGVSDISLASTLKTDPMKHQVQTLGRFTLWGIPVGARSSATIQVKIKYRVHYSDSGAIDFESKPLYITVRAKQGDLTEGLSFSSAHPIDIKEIIPKVASEIHKGRWMSYLPDDVTLNRLSIPGTHDSGANTAAATIWGQTQTLSIRGQLDAGIRYFDIRLGVKNGRYMLYHGNFNLNLDFEKDVLAVMRDFFQEYPSETVIMVLKAEWGGGLDFRNRLSSFLQNYNSQYNLFRSGYWGGYTRLGDVRGKVLIMSREGRLDMGVQTGSMGNNTVKRPDDPDFAWIAVGESNYPYEPIYWADIYKGSTSWSTKEEQIRNGIDAATKEKYSDYLVINHVNQAATFTYTPYRNANHLNSFTFNYLKESVMNASVYPVRSGIIVMDYVGESSTRSIVEILLDQSLNANNLNYRIYHKRSVPVFM